MEGKAQTGVEEALTIVIVGGVAGGASAATRARRVNERARIVLFEKDEHVSFANCGMPYWIGGEIEDRKKLLVATPELLGKRFGIEVRTRSEIVRIDRARGVVEGVDHATGERFEQRYGRLILAPGASPIVPALPGANASNVFSLRNLADMERIAAWIDREAPRRAIVVGAGFIGLEMVEQFHRRGLETALVELQDQVLPPLDREMAALVEKELRAHGVALRLGQGIAGFETEGGRAVAVTLSGGERLPADLVLLGMGVRPNTRLAEEAGLALGPSRGIQVNEYGQTSDERIYAVGDAAESVHAATGEAVRIPLAGPANRAGRIAGEHAATGRAHGIPKVAGTAIVRAFGATAAMTGLSAKAAARAGIEARSVLVEARHHAGYYPGAEPMILKLVYAPESGKVLGAQAVGGEGVDKRIDLVAAAIAFGGTVEGLTGLDLAYAPPFGSAKDPLHMAAFAAQNELDGLVEFAAAPPASGEEWLLLDVRTPAEYAQGHLPGVRHIPLDALRQRLGEIDRARPLLVVCRSGLRAYVASRILTQSGVERVAVLSGGMVAGAGA